MHARIRGAFVDINIAVCACPSWVTLAIVSVLSVLTIAILTRLRGALVNVDITVGSGPTRFTNTFVSMVITLALAILARVRFTVIYFSLAVSSRVAWSALAHVAVHLIFASSAI